MVVWKKNKIGFLLNYGLAAVDWGEVCVSTSPRTDVAACLFKASCGHGLYKESVRVEGQASRIANCLQTSGPIRLKFSYRVTCGSINALIAYR